MNATNPYCKALGIEIPRLAMAKASVEANYYSLLIVALLERGGPITLEAARLNGPSTSRSFVYDRGHLSS